VNVVCPYCGRSDRPLSKAHVLPITPDCWDDLVRPVCEFCFRELRRAFEAYERAKHRRACSRCRRRVATTRELVPNDRGGTSLQPVCTPCADELADELMRAARGLAAIDRVIGRHDLVAKGRLEPTRFEIPPGVAA
jgi:hypothetical protein